MSIIVPAHNAAHDIVECLSAIRASDVSFKYELIVVDDASDDETASLARGHADRMLSLSGSPRGPAYARNRGVDESRAPLVAFVDADVVVHRDAMSRIVSAFQSDEISAVFGSYDDKPAAPGLVSQYRNLLHHYVHHHSTRMVQSFWAGCGAVRKSDFNSVGGFDENRFHHAEMEDVELGYRLVDRGCSIQLDPAIQCTHRKRITLAGMARGDFIRRGVPWARVLLDRGEFLKPRGLSLGSSERFGAIAALAFALSVVAAIAFQSSTFAIIGGIALIGFVVVNAGFLARLAELRGVWFAVAAVPLHLLYNLTAIAALVWALVTRPFSRSALERYKLPQ